MTCAGPVHDYAIWRVENLSRFNFCLGTPRFRQLSAISAASRNSASGERQPRTGKPLTAWSRPTTGLIGHWKSLFHREEQSSLRVGRTCSDDTSSVGILTPKH